MHKVVKCYVKNGGYAQTPGDSKLTNVERERYTQTVIFRKWLSECYRHASHSSRKSCSRGVRQVNRIHVAQNSTWLVTSRLDSNDTYDLSSVLIRACSNTADDEEVVVHACTS